MPVLGQDARPHVSIAWTGANIAQALDDSDDAIRMLGERLGVCWSVPISEDEKATLEGLVEGILAREITVMVGQRRTIIPLGKR